MTEAGIEAAPRQPTTVMVRVTAAEADGASRLVAGLSVLERSVRQLLRMGHRVVVQSDGSRQLAAGLPAAVAIRTIDPRAPHAREEVPTGDEVVVGGDVVRPASRDLAGGIRVTDEASRMRAEDAVFAELLRGDLGLVARHLNKPISFRITRYVLCHLSLTPNQVTIGAAAIGLVGCCLIATGSAALGVVGLLLAHAQSILDGCDGELARVRFQQSSLGEWLDTVVDDALNLALVVALGVGLARREGAPPLVLGLAAAALLLFYNLVAYRELWRQGEGGEVLKVRWWFASGSDFKATLGARRGGLAALLALGRRDCFVFAWLLMGILGLWRLILVYALVVALINASAAAGQLIFGRPV